MSDIIDDCVSKTSIIEDLLKQAEESRTKNVAKGAATGAAMGYAVPLGLELGFGGATGPAHYAKWHKAMGYPLQHGLERSDYQKAGRLRGLQRGLELGHGIGKRLALPGALLVGGAAAFKKLDHEKSASKIETGFVEIGEMTNVYLEKIAEFEKEATAGGEFFRNKLANGAAWTGIIAGADLLGNVAHDKLNEKKEVKKNSIVAHLDKVAGDNDSGGVGVAGAAAGLGLAGGVGFKAAKNGTKAMNVAQRSFGMSQSAGAGKVSGMGKAVRAFGRVFVR